MIWLYFILIVLVTAFRVDPNQRFIKKLIRSFAKPLISFLLVTCGMSLIVSWFMGEGSTDVTGSMEHSISLGDPVIAMLLMIVLNCVVIFCYYKIFIGVLKDLKKEGSLALSFVSGVVGSLGGAITHAIGKAGGDIGDRLTGYSGVVRDSGSSDEGSSSSRARSRGSKGSYRENERFDDDTQDVSDRRRFGFFDSDLRKSKGSEDSKDSSSIENKVMLLKD